MRIAFVNGDFEEIMEVMRVRGYPKGKSFDIVEHKTNYNQSHSIRCNTMEVYSEIYTRLMKDGYVNLCDFKDSITFKKDYSEVIYGEED